MTGYYKNHVFFKPSASVTSQPKIRWPVVDAIKLLDFEDYQLVNAWLKDKDKLNPHLQAQMLSARLAEKVTTAYYGELGYLTKDISISQILPDQDDWQHFDILLNGSIPIDVKNARTPANNKKYYLNHCVPQFKYDRNKKEVFITSVMSPYLNFAQIQGKEPISADIQDIVVLGEAQFSGIQQLEKEFTSDRLKVNICATLGENTLIPAWVFDYLLTTYYANGQSIASRRTFKPNKRQMDFIQSINGYPYRKWSLPVLYLSIWSDFLERTANNDEAFNPIKYYSIYKPKGDYSFPLGIRDPLGMIFELIHSLNKLFVNYDEIKKKHIVNFQLKGQDSLLGYTKEGYKHTLIAYCGGSTIGKAKCGNGPLIFGENDTCQECGKLICDQCDFCSYLCKRSALSR